MCNHSQVQSFDGQDYCVQCNEELDTTTGMSLSDTAQQKHWDAIDRDIDAQMDDDSGDSSWVETCEEHFFNSFGE